MTETSELQLPEDRPLEIAGRVYQSRLLVGTGK
ncbi:MAG TPA: thiazole synthase, partial [Marinobacter adhaerens]|nr:thiazole synthase [Marinobacter adhaerens]HAZ89410.1 thiazole synthase [Marinobacter adhaerens]